MPTKEEMLNKARKFVIQERDRHVGYDEIAICWRSEGQWVVIVDGMHVVTKDLKLVYEPMPSSRTAIFMESTRFPLEEAWDVAERIVVEQHEEVKKRVADDGS